MLGGWGSRLDGCDASQAALRLGGAGAYDCKSLMNSLSIARKSVEYRYI